VRTASIDLTSAEAARDTRLRRIVWAALAATLAAITLVSAWRVHLGSSHRTELPIYGQVPPFALVERSGRPLTADDLAGGIWIADFIFTRCGGMCPALTTTLAALLRRLPPSSAERLRAVTFTVDPTHDDPETLRRYADGFGADAARWLFVTGDRGAVERLVREGFRLSIAELPPGERERSLEPITHSDRFALVDARLRIRGYYHGTDPDDVARLEHDIAALSGTGT
jgi:protein SCO1/2